MMHCMSAHKRAPHTNDGWTKKSYSQTHTQYIHKHTHTTLQYESYLQITIHSLNDEPTTINKWQHHFSFVFVLHLPFFLAINQNRDRDHWRWRNFHSRVMNKSYMLKFTRWLYVPCSLHGVFIGYYYLILQDHDIHGSHELLTFDDNSYSLLGLVTGFKAYSRFMRNVRSRQIAITLALH